MSIAYLDTWVYSGLTKDPDLNEAVGRMLRSRQAVIGISMYNVFELHRATRQHLELFKITRKFPTFLLRTPGYILAEEVNSYPHYWRGDLRWRNLSHHSWRFLPAPMKILLLNGFTAFMSAQLTRQASLAPTLYSTGFQEFCNFLKERNLIPADADPHGKIYTPEHADLFANLQTFQTLQRSHHTLNYQKIDGNDPDTSPIRSLRMSAYLEYWKFNHEQRTPNTKGDLADQLHSIYYPYCTTIVTEKHVATVLKKIKRHSNLLANVDILTKKDLKTKYG